MKKTIYELLGMVKDGKAPKKIKYKNKIYEWKEYDACYGKIMTKKGWVKEYGYVAEENRTYFYLKHCYQDLNDMVEILEEPKGIPEKLDDILGIDDLEPPYDENLDKIWRQTIKNQNKINKIIDYLESKGE